MRRLAEARKRDEQMEHSRNDEFSINIDKTIEDDVSCITNPTFVGGVYLADQILEESNEVAMEQIRESSCEESQSRYSDAENTVIFDEKEHILRDNTDGSSQISQKSKKSEFEFHPFPSYSHSCADEENEPFLVGVNYHFESTNYGSFHLITLFLFVSYV